MYSYPIHVRFSEVDNDLHISLPSILTEFQDCSCFHAASLGMGVSEMLKEGHVWILSSWQVIIDRRPKMGEELTVGTWAYGWKDFYGYRNFILQDESKQLAAYANTIWIYADIKTGRPAKIPKEVSDAYSIEPQLPMEVAPRKIPVPAAAVNKEPVTVRRSDIDALQHVNNERYVLIAQEFLPDGFETRQMRAEYRRAAQYGDILYPSVSGKDEIVTVCLNDRDAKPYAIIEFTGTSRFPNERRTK